MENPDSVFAEAKVRYQNDEVLIGTILVQAGDEGGVQADGDRHALAGLLDALGHAQPL